MGDCKHDWRPFSWWPRHYRCFRCWALGILEGGRVEALRCSEPGCTELAISSHNRRKACAKHR